MNDMTGLDKAALDRWITTEPESTDPLDEGDPAIVVANLVTEEERVQILARLSLLNGGRTDGIHLADALDVMYDSDAMLGKVEALYEAWRLTFGADRVDRTKPFITWTPAHTMVVYVLALLDRAITTENVKRFLERTFVEEVEADEDFDDVRPGVSFYKAGSLITGAQILEGVEVVSCSLCCALVPDDDEHANREQHARSAHGLGATR